MNSNTHEQQRLRWELEELQRQKVQLIQVQEEVESRLLSGKYDSVEIRVLKKKWKDNDKKLRAIYKKIDDKKQQCLFPRQR